MGRTPDENGDGSGDGIESSSGDGNLDGSGNMDGIGDGKGIVGREERGRGGAFWYPPRQERSSTVEEQALPFHARHHLRRQEMAPAVSQKLLE